MGSKVCMFFLVYLISMNYVSADCWLQDKETGRRFIIYNALLYENMPSMSEFCIKPINVVYAWQLFNGGAKKGSFNLPRNNEIHKVVSEIKAKKLITVIDIEHWPLKDSQINMRSIENYLSVLRSLKQEVPEIMIGYYGAVPVIDFHGSSAKKSSSRYQDWIKNNNNVQPIADAVDATFPSLYTIDPNRERWLDNAKSVVTESRRLAPNKPLYPFIWPNYHDQGGKYPEDAEVEADYWSMQLLYLSQHADGIVLWGGYKQKFRNDMIWWKQTVKFIHDHFYIRFDSQDSSTSK